MSIKVNIESLTLQDGALVEEVPATEEHVGYKIVCGIDEDIDMIVAGLIYESGAVQLVELEPDQALKIMEWLLLHQSDINNLIKKLEQKDR